MRRSNWISGIGFFLGLVILGPAFAEFSVGLGDIEKPSSDASARFNEGLSSFHLMLAALDKKNAEEASKQQAIAEQKIQEAASLYEAATRTADNHLLIPNPRTEQELAEVTFFMAHAAAYGVKLPVKQRDLVITSSNLVREFSMRIRSEDAKSLVGDLRRRQALTDAAVELQAFLVSVTTMLTLG
jgi:hypothetical protein